MGHAWPPGYCEGVVDQRKTGARLAEARASGCNRRAEDASMAIADIGSETMDFLYDNTRKGDTAVLQRDVLLAQISPVDF